jgi:hypothetical protein
MAFRALPRFAAWRHQGARDGFEVVFLRSVPNGHRVEGHTAAVEAGDAWAVGYSIVAAADWTTRSARVVGHSASGRRERTLEADGAGAWLVDGSAAPQLDGCLDVDLESSSFTNALPVHRLGLGVGDAADAPAAYVRALDLSVERLEQRYARVADTGARATYEYAAPRFDYADRLVYDAHGLVLAYPALAVRAV